MLMADEMKDFFPKFFIARNVTGTWRKVLDQGATACA